jgi:pilus assembly protein CpaB
MGRRTLLLIASILVAALGTALIWLYVQGADNRAAGHC